MPQCSQSREWQAGRTPALRNCEARCQPSQIGDRVYLALRQISFRQDADRYQYFLYLPFTGPIGR